MSTKSKTKKGQSTLAKRKALFPWLVPLATLRLTLTLLSLSMVLIFIATLEQVEIGIRGAQAKYFESLFGIWHYPTQFWGGEYLNSIPIPIPGGWLLGGLLIINLTAAYVTRFQWTMKKFGIQLIHLGIIMLLVGQLVTQAIQEESRMQINKGESSNYIERFHGVELALIDVTDPKQETVVSIPQELLEAGGLISSEDLPFQVSVKSFDISNSAYDSFDSCKSVEAVSRNVKWPDWRSPLNVFAGITSGSTCPIPDGKVALAAVVATLSSASGMVPFEDQPVQVSTTWLSVETFPSRVSFSL